MLINNLCILINNYNHLTTNLAYPITNYHPTPSNPHSHPTEHSPSATTNNSYTAKQSPATPDERARTKSEKPDHLFSRGRRLNKENHDSNSKIQILRMPMQVTNSRITKALGIPPLALVSVNDRLRIYELRMWAGFWWKVGSFWVGFWFLNDKII